MKMQMIEVELTAAQRAELEDAKGDPDAMETILSRIADEAIAMKTPKLDLLDAVRDIAKELRMNLMRDVILNAHHYLHEGGEGRDRAMMLLCPTAALLEGESPPLDVLTALFDALNKGNAEREKASCGGTA